MSVAPADSRETADSRIAVWLVSLTLHALLIAMVATSSGRWFGVPGTNDGAGDVGEEFRSVGVVAKSNDSKSDPHDAAREADPAVDPGEGKPMVAPDGPVVPESAPVDLELPMTTDHSLGAGHAAPPSRAPADVGDTVRPGGAFDRIPVGGLAPGETRFFGIRDKGTRIVYLIDISGSMGGAKLTAAKSQVLVSLESLGAKQQFQVVFYNEISRAMNGLVTGGDARECALFQAEGVYLARSVNKTRTRQYLGSVTADGGTDRQAALEEGLSYRPDVLYFLTDGDGVELDAKKRSDIARLNDGRTRIHCIEFGDGQPPTVRTPLKRLASENDGLYRFVPVGVLR